eukprot:symbB.v1.2.002937.t1/scaffold162.1/size290285/10
MWRSLGEAKPRDDAKPRVSAATRELPERPPEDALPRPDGSRLQLLEDNSLLRWTQRSNGSWRKPELWPVDKDQLEWLTAQISKHQTELAEKRVAKEEETKRKRMERLAQAPAAVAAAKAAAAAAKAGGPDVDVSERLAQLLSLREPPSEAILQPDGTSQIDLEDGATIRWSRRPDGSWRKPEHRRAGWVDELEQAKYVPPTMRLLDGATSGATRAVLLLDDDDYNRDIPLRSTPASKSYAQSQAPRAPNMKAPEPWQVPEPHTKEVNGRRKEESNKMGGKHRGKATEAEKKSVRSGAERYVTKEDRKVDMELLPALTRLCVANGWQ